MGGKMWLGIGVGRCMSFIIDMIEVSLEKKTSQNGVVRMLTRQGHS